MSIRRFFLRLWLLRAFVTRGLLCWAIGCLILSADEVTSYDFRLQVRGDQVASPDVVLIYFRPSDFQKYNRLKAYYENVGLTDASFWEENVWTDLLENVLSYHPMSVGVTLVLPEQIYPPPSTQSLALYADQRIFWGMLNPQNENRSRSPFSAYRSVQVASVDLVQDDDGIIRRFISASHTIPHIAEVLTKKTLNLSWMPRFINFRGTPRVFKQFSARDVIAGKVDPDNFKNKIVLIGGETVFGSKFPTPMGNFSRMQVIAQIVDNLHAERWIQRAPFYIYCVLLLGLIILASLVISNYPPTIAFSILIFSCFIILSISVWTFDNHYFWFPFVSPVMMILVSWIIFVGHQASVMEQRTWRMEQDKKFQSDIERLKTNFVSLISHDLKTPIAKIQAIADRLLVQNLTEPIQKDLRNLRASSDELHQYIQSILKLLRVESQDLKLNREACDLNEIITQALAQLQPLANEKNISVRTHLEPLFSIEADPTLIREVLVNLLDNAVKYTPVRGEITLSTREIEDRVLVTISDNGVGIPLDEQDFVWQKFVRGKEQALKSKGSGLGLYLVKFFIELHGGQVTLESSPSKGTKVSFSLPLEAEE